MFWSHSSRVGGATKTGKCARFPKYVKLMGTGLIWLLVMAAKPAQATTATELDEAFQSFNHDFYTALIKQTSPARHPPAELKAILASDLSAPEAAVLIRANQSVILEDADGELFWSALEWLYRANDTASVRDFMDFLKQRKRPDALARARFRLARYYEDRSEWTAVHGTLAKVDNRHLPPKDAEYAVFLRGFALQQAKQHRESTRFYQEIAPASPWYPHARLNEGIAYLRQGWWSEAHLEFQKAITASAEAGNAELHNRLLVVLGYSQLHFEFYRNARDTFRKVSLESVYTQRALLGLGLAAAHQTDFESALNAFLRLTDSGAANDSVDEAWLLLPHTYEELGQRALAIDAYQKAKSWYGQRLAEVAKSLAAIDNETVPTLEKITLYQEAAAEMSSAVQPVPTFVEENLRLLGQLRELDKTRRLPTGDALKVRYEQWINHALRTAQTERVNALKGYQSQAQFGLARLYDQE